VNPRTLPGFAGFSAPALGADVLAGLTLAAIAIPEQMATARLAGLAPQAAFFALIAAAVGFAIFGANRRLSVGADSTIAPIFAGALAMIAAAGSSQYVVLAAALAVIAGLLIVAAGFLRMGWVGNLLSLPVLTGFLAGIAAHIIVGQAPSALGVEAGSGEMLAKAWGMLTHLDAVNPRALAISGGVFAALLVSHRLSPRLPGALVAIIVASLVVKLLHWDAAGVSVLGHISTPAPRFQLPAADVQAVVQILPVALLVALVAMVQTAAVAHAYADPGEVVDRDLIGLGAANLLAGLFGAFPVNASPPRTAIVVEGGGRTQAAALVCAAAAAAVIVFGTGFLGAIPHAALAGVLFFVATRIFHLRDIIGIARVDRGEAVIMGATFAALIILPIAQGVAVGVAMSLVQGAWTSARAHLRRFHRQPGTTIWWPVRHEAAETDPDPGLVVVAFQAPLNFLNADSFKAQVLNLASSAGVRTLILEAAGVVEVDFTAARALKELIAALKSMNVVFAVARLESVEAQRAFARYGVTHALGHNRLFSSVAEAVEVLAPEDGSQQAPAIPAGVAL
jgi:sulfate permease, SulP family